MIYLDCAATSFQKPASVRRAVSDAMERLSSPGRGGYRSAMAAADFAYLRQHADRDQVVSALVVASSLGGGVLVMLVHGTLLNRVRRRKAGP